MIFWVPFATIELGRDKFGNISGRWMWNGFKARGSVGRKWRAHLRSLSWRLLANYSEGNIIELQASVCWTSRSRKRVCFEDDRPVYICIKIPSITMSVFVRCGVGRVWRQSILSQMRMKIEKVSLELWASHPRPPTASCAFLQLVSPSPLWF